jgi:membrane protein implicated in regulation of membrane protease activity
VNWADFYLFCFGFGFLFSLVALVLGHFQLDWGAADASGADTPDIGNAAHGDTAAAVPDSAGSEHHALHISYFNMTTISAFLAWFGGAGYLVTTFYTVWFVLTLLLSVATGLVGAYVVFWFLTRVLMREREELDPADYDMIGVLGTVSGAIRADGIGEILFSQAGSRRAAPARSETGIQIPSGTEVVVTRYEGGIAYVRRWDEFTASVATEA